MPTADLELMIEQGGVGYLATARFTHADGVSTTTLARDVPFRIDWPALRNADLDDGEYGRRLSEMLFADQQLGAAWREARGYASGTGEALRVRLRFDAAPELHSIAWERAHDPTTSAPMALSQQVLLSRYLDTSDLTPIRIPEQEELSALVCVASPSDLDKFGLAAIDADEEVIRVTAALGDIPATVLSPTSPAGQATFARLTEALQTGPSLLYLVAHGSIVDGQPYLWLEQRDGTSHRLPGAKLAEQITNLSTRPLLIVLAICHGAGSSHSEEAVAALGPLLARHGVGAVLAMQGPIGIASIELMMPTLFQQLRRDGQIDRALAAARAALHDSPEWWRPALFLRVANGRLFALSQPTLPWEQYRQRLYEELRRQSGAELDALFIPPRVQLEPLATAAPVVSADEQDSLTSASSLNIVGREQAQVFVGPPGADKMAFLRYVALCMAAPELPVESPIRHLRADKRPLPFLIDAERLSAHSVEEFVAALAGVAGASMGASVRPETMRTLLLAGRQVLLAFDKLDSLSPFERSHVIALIAELARAFPRILIIIAVQAANYDPAPLRAAGFIHYALLEYNLDQLAVFVARQFLADAEAVALLQKPLVALRALSFAPGQDWQLALYRPEEAPGSVEAKAHMFQLLGLTTRPDYEQGRRVSTNLIALVGSRRAGKTTLLREVQIAIAQDTERAGSGPLVFYVELMAGEQPRRSGPLLYSLLVETARARLQPLGRLNPADMLAHLLEHGTLGGPDRYGPRCIFLVDGLDALPESQQIALARELDHLAQRLPGHAIVLSGTQSSFPRQLGNRAHVMLLQQLGEQQVYEYVRQRTPETEVPRLLLKLRENRLVSLMRDPGLLEELYELLSYYGSGVTRNQVIQRYFDRAMQTVPPQLLIGNVLRESLAGLAWKMRLGYLEYLSIGEVFGWLRAVRGDREYNLEELFRALLDANMLILAGPDKVSFGLPALESYLAALGLASRPIMLSRLSGSFRRATTRSWWAGGRR